MRRPAGASRRFASVVLLAACSLGVMAVDALARDHLWRSEWRWATFQYQFGTILLAPVVAGIAAWDGRRQAQAAWLVAPSQRTIAVWAPLGWRIVAAWVGYLGAFAIPVVLVLRSGTDDRFTLDALVMFGPALSVLAAAIGLGTWAGLRWPYVVVPPLVAGTVFAAIIIGWVAGAEALVRVGGSGTSMATFEPVPSVQALQVVAYVGVAVAAGGFAEQRQFHRRRASAVAVAALVAASVVGGWLCVGAGSAVRDRPARWACVTSGQHDFCALAAYRHVLPAAAGTMRRGVARLDRAGAGLPRRLELGHGLVTFFERTDDDAVRGELEALLAGRLRIAQCSAPEVMSSEASALFGRWLSNAAGIDPGGAPREATPDVLRDGTPREQDAWAAAVIARLRAACER